MPSARSMTMQIQVARRLGQQCWDMGVGLDWIAVDKEAAEVATLRINGSDHAANPQSVANLASSFGAPLAADAHSRKIFAEL